MRCLFLLLALFIVSESYAQKGSWKKIAKEADKLYGLGQYEKAAKLYESAFDKKDKKEFMFKAGESYYTIKSYRKAAEAYKHIRRDVDKFGLAGLKYGRCLKQDEQYVEAKNELEYFLKEYKKSDKTTISQIVKNEIKGCELAIALKENDVVPNDINIALLTENINSTAAEFAPLPYSDDILYFSSTLEGQARIFRSQRISGEWTQAVKPNLPKIEGHVCNGTFSPDNERFYFNVCKSNERWKGLGSNCDIYLTIRKANSWNPPIKLRDYVKMEGTTAIHPHVVHQGNLEILYFSSDRPGGKGGLDIWYMTRPTDSGDIDFSLPRNAGKSVNTIGDEITPFYNAASKTLYFSSNGQVSIGGFDVFKAKGERSAWSDITNMGLPINSSADDYYYSFNPTGGDAFFVSNRLFGLEKINSTDADIFSVSSPERTLMVKGKVFDKNKNQLIKDVVVKLYEIKSDGGQRLLDSKTFPDGNYSFGLIPDRDLRIIAEPNGFAPASHDFDTRDFENSKNYGKDLHLTVAAVASNTRTKPSVYQPTKKPTPPKNTTTTPTKRYTQPSTKPQVNTRPANPPIIRTQPSKPPRRNNATTSASVHSGTYYKVQLTVVVRYDEFASEYNGIKEMGHLDTEYLPAKSWTRVLLADFFSVSEARNAMLRAHSMGYPQAFLVRYKDGKRMTP